MMRSGLIRHWVLDELKPRNTDSVERLMISASSVAHCQRGHAEISEGLHPGFENRGDCLVLLKINAANLSRSVVYVEIRGDFGLLRLKRYWSCLPAQKRR